MYFRGENKPCKDLCGAKKAICVQRYGQKQVVAFDEDRKETKIVFALFRSDCVCKFKN